MATEKYLDLVKELLGSCKNCGLGNMIVEGNFHLYPNVEDNTVIPNKGTTIIIAICQNCGYTHSFSKNVLDKKLASK